jgi:hypothetical protein
VGAERHARNRHREGERDGGGDGRPPERGGGERRAIADAVHDVERGRRSRRGR